MNNISYIKEENCYGCTACSVICSHNAIQMISSKKGFYIPKLNSEKCINCGMCLKCCPACQKKGINNNISKEIKSYALRHKSDNVRFLSSSGGAFSAIVETFLEREDCVVYGAAFHKGKVCHLRVAPSNIQELRKSKYVQSDLGRIFFNIREDLKNGLTVIFCGTPCQVDGLNLFLEISKVDRKNLLVLDFVCHGTLSPLLFNKYLRYCEKKKHERIVDHCFRSKKEGWHKYIAENVFASGKVDSKSFTSQLFTALFYTNYSFKESCYNCKFTSIKRMSDITLADFWGIEKHLPELDDNKGISFVMANTAKGNMVLQNLQSVDLIEVPLNYTDQPHLNHPVSRPKDNDEFWEYFNKHGFKKMAVKYLKAGRIRRMLSACFRKGVRLIK